MVLGYGQSNIIEQFICILVLADLDQSSKYRTAVARAQLCHQNQVVMN